MLWFKKKQDVQLRCRCHVRLCAQDAQHYTPICEQHYRELNDRHGAYVIVGSDLCDLEFLVDGKRHREGAPAVEHTDGTVMWYRHGKPHRLDGPAITWFNGTQEWYVDGKRHRVGAPALVRPGGACEWHFQGNLHREDGPAVQFADGRALWFLHGQPMVEQHMPYVQAAQIHSALSPLQGAPAHRRPSFL